MANDWFKITLSGDSVCELGVQVNYFGQLDEWIDKAIEEDRKHIQLEDSGGQARHVFYIKSKSSEDNLKKYVQRAVFEEFIGNNENSKNDTFSLPMLEGREKSMMKRLKNKKYGLISTVTDCRLLELGGEMSTAQNTHGDSMYRDSYENLDEASMHDQAELKSLSLPREKCDAKGGGGSVRLLFTPKKIRSAVLGRSASNQEDKSTAKNRPRSWGAEQKTSVPIQSASRVVLQPSQSSQYLSLGQTSVVNHPIENYEALSSQSALKDFHSSVSLHGSMRGRPLPEKPLDIVPQIFPETTSDPTSDPVSRNASLSSHACCNKQIRRMPDAFLPAIYEIEQHAEQLRLLKKDERAQQKACCLEKIAKSARAFSSLYEQVSSTDMEIKMEVEVQKSCNELLQFIQVVQFFH